MATAQHPAFSDVTHEIAEADVPKWSAAGWQIKGRKSESTKSSGDSVKPKSESKKK